jgi:hypothetical protein
VDCPIKERIPVSMGAASAAASPTGSRPSPPPTSSPTGPLATFSTAPSSLLLFWNRDNREFDTVYTYKQTSKPWASWHRSTVKNFRLLIWITANIKLGGWIVEGWLTIVSSSALCSTTAKLMFAHLLVVVQPHVYNLKAIL